MGSECSQRVMGWFEFSPASFVGKVVSQTLRHKYHKIIFIAQGWPTSRGRLCMCFHSLHDSSFFLLVAILSDSDICFHFVSIFCEHIWCATTLSFAYFTCVRAKTLLHIKRGATVVIEIQPLKHILDVMAVRKIKWK